MCRSNCFQYIMSLIYSIVSFILAVTCSLGFMHVNIRSLLPKFVLFTALAHSVNPDALAVSESWLRKTTKNPEISIPNYNIFRQGRTAKGGGVAIYCRDSLQNYV